MGKVSRIPHYLLITRVPVFEIIQTQANPIRVLRNRVPTAIIWPCAKVSERIAHTNVPTKYANLAIKE